MTDVLQASRTLLSGNEAIARGAWEAGVQVASGYPGTPSTEILQALVGYEEVDVRWAPNEKVGLDVALGACFGGARAFTSMKHVGLNVAADTFMTASYTGVSAGLVITVADDPGMHSSQNEQDTRFYARFGSVPLLEPAGSGEAREYVRFAFELSEQFDTPVIVRTTTRVSHNRGVVPTLPRDERPGRGFHRDPAKYVMLPAYARQRRPLVIDRMQRLRDYVESDDLAIETYGDPRIGIVTSGIVYQYVREAAPDASVFKLGLSYPLPIERIRRFAARVDRLLVVEELDPLVERELQAAGIAVEGKAFFPQAGEFDPDVVREGLVRAGMAVAPVSTNGQRRGDAALTTVEEAVADPPDGAGSLRLREPLPTTVGRPPVLCPGCPHTGPFVVLKNLGAVVAGDIGCYTLAALPPISAMDTCIAMGSSIGVATGIAAAGDAPGPVVATIGDSTFLHGGIPGLMDAVYNDVDITVLILDNGIVAMTGGQQHPGTGTTLGGMPARPVDLIGLCQALGVQDVRVVDPYDVSATYSALEHAMNHTGPSVVITNRPCVVYPSKVKDQPFEVRDEACTACQSCMNLGCPALLWTEDTYDGRPKVTIDPDVCTGCAVCPQMCPPGAIVLAADPEDDRG